MDCFFSDRERQRNRPVPTSKNVLGANDTQGVPDGHPNLAWRDPVAKSDEARGIARLARFLVIGRKSLLQLRVLGFGLLQNGDVGIGIFPAGEEIFRGGERPDAGGIGSVVPRDGPARCANLVGRVS
jgi:hypothetical protein